jgi:hypothetical protein
VGKIFSDPEGGKIQLIFIRDGHEDRHTDDIEAIFEEGLRAHEEVLKKLEDGDNLPRVPFLVVCFGKHEVPKFAKPHLWDVNVSPTRSYQA